MTLTTPLVNVTYRYESTGDIATRIFAAESPVITMAANSELKTTFHGRFFDYRESGVDFLQEELRIIATINDNEYNLGYYIITSETISTADGVTTIEIEGYSRLYYLKQSKIETRAYFAAGTLYTDALYTLLVDGGITKRNIAASALTFATDREDWEVGTDRLTIINALLAEMSYNSAYVDNNGIVQLTPAVEASPANVDITYFADRYSIIGADYTMSSDRHGKPNVFMAMCSNPDLAESLTSVVENDTEDNPYSTVYRPRVLSVVKVDNIASQAALDDYVYSLLIKSLLSDETVSFETMLNPEHTCNDILALGNGELSGVFAETGWTMTLDYTARMTHTARRKLGYAAPREEPEVPKVLSYYGVITPLSAARQYLSAASVGDYALFGGGLDGSTSIAVVDAYDTALTRTTPTVLSVARRIMDATSVGNYALFGGGYDKADSAVVDAYDAALTRTTPTVLSVARRNLTAIGVGNYALFGGGLSSTKSAVVDAYDTALTRTTPTVLSAARYILSATSVGIYALFGGGLDGAARSAVVDAYDTALTRTTPTVLSVARSYLSAASVGNYALFGGGYDGAARSAVVDAYDTALTRTTPTVLSAARQYLSAASVGNYALFGGGLDGASSAAVDAYVYA